MWSIRRENRYMRDVLLQLVAMFNAILILVLRVGLAYGICLLFTAEVNPLLWSTTAKVWLVIVFFLLMANIDDK